MTYRSEIDGLRALAVVPVILFHAGFSVFSGGFIGVDVFFVISGFLITSLLMNDLAQGRFSLLTFYERRARRILPALFLIVALTVPAAWFLFPMGQLKEFGESVASVSVFASNIFFWLHTGYFETASELKPLLHTWSLAVEEQYYLAAPILLRLLWRYARKALMPALFAVTVAGLAIAEYGTRMWPEAAFFLAHTRIWELAIGALAALAVIRWGGPRRNNVLSMLGLAMIVGAVFLYDRGTPFPGVFALLPVVGTVLVLVFAGTGTLTNRILSMPVFVGIGLISYSAYLWHQPLFAYTRYVSIQDPATSVMIGLSAASLGLAYLSWRFVEQPFRNRETVSRHAIFGFSAAGVIACLVLGAFLAYSDAAKERVTRSGTSYLQLSKSMQSNRGLARSCVDFRPECASGPKPVAVLWGDSHAMHLALALKNSPTSLPFMQVTKAVCAPILGIAGNGESYNVEWGKGCIRHNDKVYEWIAGHPEVRYVILASQFREVLGEFSLTFPDGAVAHRPGGVAAARLQETIRRLKELGKTVVLISPTPTRGYDVGRCLVIRNILGQNPDLCNFPLAGQVKEARYLKLAEIAAESGVKLILLSDLICPDGVCRSHLDGTMIYRDEGHLTREGSAKLGALYDLAGRVMK
jgi:peptidoglycan/LPS O-acetylase OafA/YrhL